MEKKIDYHKKVIHILEELKKLYPTYGIAKHMVTALFNYKDPEFVGNKELLFALEKHKTSLELGDLASETEIKKIIEDGLNLEKWMYEDLTDENID